MTNRLKDCLVGLASFALVACTIHLSSDGRDIAAVWPANAIILAALLDRRRRSGTGLYAAGFVANVAANVVMRGPSPGLLLYGVCNVIEIGVAARLLRPALAENGLPSAPAVVGRFIVVCGVIAPVLSGLGGSVTAWLLFGQDYLGALISWVLSDGLGLLIFTPFFLAVLRGDYRRCFLDKDWRQRVEALGLQVMIASVTYTVFFISERPILFILFGPLMWVTFKLGRLGTTLSVMIIAVLGAVATQRDQGPIAMIAMDHREQAFLLQIFLVVLLLTCLPVASALAARGANFELLSRKAADLRMEGAELARRASTDALTGILNRAGFYDEALAMLGERARGPLSLIALDLDLFKQVNDQHGHQIGDQALIHLVAVLRDGLREHDALGRIGGDEFLILLSKTDFEQASLIAARLRDTLRRTPLILADGTVLLLSTSYGVAVHQDGMNFENLAHAADSALYEFKRRRHVVTKSA